MADPAIALGIKTPDINTMQNFQTAQSTAINQAGAQQQQEAQALQSVAEMGFGVMGGKIDGPVDPTRAEQAVSLLGDNPIAQKLKDHPELWPVVTQGSLKVLQFSQDSQKFDLAKQQFGLDMQNAEQKLATEKAAAPTTNMQYNTTTGTPEKVQWDATTRTWQPMGGPQAPTSANGAGTADMQNLAAINADRTKSGQPQMTMEEYMGAKSGAGGDDAQVKSVAKGVMSGLIPPDGKYYKNTLAVQAELADQGYNLSQAREDYAATNKLLATMNGSQQTRLRQSITQVSDALNLVDQLSQQWKGNNWPVLNKANILAASQGAPGYSKDQQSLATQLVSEISDVTTDLATVYSGGNTSTDQKLELAGKQLDASWSEETLHNAIALAKQNIVYRENSLKLSTAGIADSKYNPTKEAPTAEPANVGPAGVTTPGPAPGLTAPNVASGVSAPSDGPVAPKAGDIQDGYRFKGGDPSDQRNWDAVN